MLGLFLNRVRLQLVYCYVVNGTCLGPLLHLLDRLNALLGLTNVSGRCPLCSTNPMIIFVLGRWLSTFCIVVLTTLLL